MLKRSRSDEKHRAIPVIAWVGKGIKHGNRMYDTDRFWIKWNSAVLDDDQIAKANSVWRVVNGLDAIPDEWTDKHIERIQSGNHLFAPKMISGVTLLSDRIEDGVGYESYMMWRAGKSRSLIIMCDLNRQLLRMDRDDNFKVKAPDNMPCQRDTERGCKCSPDIKLRVVSLELIKKAKLPYGYLEIQSGAWIDDENLVRELSYLQYEHERPLSTIPLELYRKPQKTRYISNGEWKSKTDYGIHVRPTSEYMEWAIKEGKILVTNQGMVDRFTGEVYAPEESLPDSPEWDDTSPAFVNGPLFDDSMIGEWNDPDYQLPEEYQGFEPPSPERVNEMMQSAYENQVEEPDELPDETPDYAEHPEQALIKKEDMPDRAESVPDPAEEPDPVADDSDDGDLTNDIDSLGKMQAAISQFADLFGDSMNKTVEQWRKANPDGGIPTAKDLVDTSTSVRHFWFRIARIIAEFAIPFPMPVLERGQDKNLHGRFGSPYGIPYRIFSVEKTFEAYGYDEDYCENLRTLGEHHLDPPPYGILTIKQYPPEKRKGDIMQDTYFVVNKLTDIPF